MLFKHNQNVTGFNGSTLGYQNLGYFPILGSRDFIFHLHCFKHTDGLTVLDGIADFDLDIQNSSGHGRFYLHTTADRGGSLGGSGLGSSFGSSRR